MAQIHIIPSNFTFTEALSTIFLIHTNSSICKAYSLSHILLNTDYMKGNHGCSWVVSAMNTWTAGEARD